MGCVLTGGGGWTRLCSDPGLSQKVVGRVSCVRAPGHRAAAFAQCLGVDEVEGEGSQNCVGRRCQASTPLSRPLESMWSLPFLPVFINPS